MAAAVIEVWEVARPFLPAITTARMASYLAPHLRSINLHAVRLAIARGNGPAFPRDGALGHVARHRNCEGGGLVVTSPGTVHQAGRSHLGDFGVAPASRNGAVFLAQKERGWKAVVDGHVAITTAIEIKISGALVQGHRGRPALGGGGNARAARAAGLETVPITW